MNTYEVTFNNETLFIVIAGDEDEAIKKALDRWNQRAPLTAIKLKKKVKRIIHYAVTNYYKQDVLVDEDLDVDEIKDLWNADNIETSSEPVPEDNFCDIEIDYNSIWVE